MKVAAKDQKTTITTAGATSTYNELTDGDSGVEADHPEPETKLEGVYLLRASQHRTFSSLMRSVISRHSEPLMRTSKQWDKSIRLQHGMPFFTLQGGGYRIPNT